MSFLWGDRMTGIEVLATIAQLGVAITGFSGIVIAVRQRGVETWTPSEILRFRNMLLYGAYLLFFALFPFLPHYFGASESQTWSFSCGLFALGLASKEALTILMMHRHRVPHASRVWGYIYVFGNFSFAALLLGGALLVAGTAQFAIYLAGLGWTLFIAVSLFVRFLLPPMKAVEGG